MSPESRADIVAEHPNSFAHADMRRRRLSRVVTNDARPIPAAAGLKDADPQASAKRVTAVWDLTVAATARGCHRNSRSNLFRIVAGAFRAATTARRRSQVAVHAAATGLSRIYDRMGLETEPHLVGSSRCGHPSSWKVGTHFDSRREPTFTASGRAPS
jgi:hypothetical protein